MPTPFLRRVLCGAVLALLALWAATLVQITRPVRAQTTRAQAVTAKGLFWKVTSATTTIHVLGSIHLASPDMYPLAPEIEQAFKDSTVLVVEADITKVNQLALAARLMRDGMYPADDSLDKHISPESFKQIKEAAQPLGLPAELIVRMRPWMAGLTLTAAAAEKIGMDADLGIDKHFLDAARGKRIAELESADYQIDLLAGLPDKQQEAALSMDASEASDLATELKKMVQAWKSGDAAAIDKMTTEEYARNADAKALMDALLYNRNDAMARKIADILAGKDPAFVVLGAAHLVGERGILRQLEKRNFKVERPDLTAPPASTATRP